MLLIKGRAASAARLGLDGESGGEGGGRMTDVGSAPWPWPAVALGGLTIMSGLDDADDGWPSAGLLSAEVDAGVSLVGEGAEGADGRTRALMLELEPCEVDREAIGASRDGTGVRRTSAMRREQASGCLFALSTSGGAVDSPAASARKLVEPRAPDADRTS